MKSFFKTAIIVAVMSCVISLIMTVGEPVFYGEVEVVSVDPVFGSDETHLVVKDRVTSREIDVVSSFGSRLKEGDNASLYVDNNISWLWPGYNSETEFKCARLVYSFGLSFFILLWCVLFSLLLNSLIKTIVTIVNARFKTARRRTIKCYTSMEGEGQKIYYVEGLSLRDQFMITEVETSENKLTMTIAHKNWHPVKRICSFEQNGIDKPREGQRVLAIKFGPVWMFSADNTPLFELIVDFRKHLFKMLFVDLLGIACAILLFCIVVF